MAINLRDKAFKQAFLENLPPEKYLKMKNYKYLKDETKYLLLLLKVLDKLDEVGDEKVINSDYTSDSDATQSHHGDRSKHSSKQSKPKHHKDKEKDKSRNSSQNREKNKKPNTPKGKPAQHKQKHRKGGHEHNSDNDLYDEHGHEKSNHQGFMPNSDIDEKQHHGNSSTKKHGGIVHKATSAHVSAFGEDKCIEVSRQELCHLLCGKKPKKGKKCKDCHKNNSKSGTEGSSKKNGHSKEKKKKHSELDLNSATTDGASHGTSQTETKKKRRGLRCCRKRSKNREKKKKEKRESFPVPGCDTSLMKCRWCVKKDGSRVLECKEEKEKVSEPKPKKEKKEKVKKEKVKKEKPHKEKEKCKNCSCNDENLKIRLCISNADTQCFSCKTLGSTDYSGSSVFHSDNGKPYNGVYLSRTSSTHGHTDTESGPDDPKQKKLKPECLYLPSPYPNDKKLDKNEVYVCQTEEELDGQSGKVTQKPKNHRIKADSTPRNVIKNKAPAIPSPKFDSEVKQRDSKSKVDAQTKKKQYKLFKIAHKNKEKQSKKGMPEQHTAITDNGKQPMSALGTVHKTTFEKEKFPNQWQQRKKESLDCFVLQPLPGDQWKSIPMTPKNVIKREESRESFHLMKKEGFNSSIESDDDEEPFIDYGSENEFIKMQAPFSRCISELDILPEQQTSLDKIHILYREDVNPKPRDKINKYPHCTRDERATTSSRVKRKSFSDFDLGPRMVKNGVKQQMISYYPEKSASTIEFTKGTKRLPDEKPLESYLLNEKIISKIRDDRMFYQLTSPYAHIKKKNCLRPDTFEDIFKVLSDTEEKFYENVPRIGPSGIISSELLQMVSNNMKGNLQKYPRGHALKINFLGKKNYNVQTIPYSYCVRIDESTKEEICSVKSTKLDNDPNFYEESSYGVSDEDVIASCTIRQIPDLESETMDSLLLSYQNNATNKSGQLSLKNLENVDPSVQCMLLGRMVMFLLGRDGKNE